MNTRTAPPPANRQRQAQRQATPQQSRQVAVQQPQAQVTIRDHLTKMEPEFAKALPGHISAEKFVRTAQTAIALTRNIDKVQDPRSLLAACTKAAADGLILDGREAALVVDHKGECQYRPMMRGLLKLAFNSGQIKSLVVELVRDGDEFDYSPTRAEQPIIHRINFRETRGEVYAAYAQATLKDGGIIHEVMTADDINRIRDRSDAWKAFKNERIRSTPWSTDWSEMARKTVFRRLSKYLPSSVDDRLHQAAERIDDDYSFAVESEPAAGNGASAPQRKKRGGAAALINAQAQNANPPHDPDTGEIIDADDTHNYGDDRDYNDDPGFGDYDQQPEDDI